MKNILMVEGFKPQETKAGRKYYSFWVKILLGEMFISIAGWKYFPDLDTVSSPSIGKGQEKGFFNTCKMNVAFYKAVQQKARQSISEAA